MESHRRVMLLSLMRPSISYRTIDISIATTSSLGKYRQHQISLATIYSTQMYQFVCSAKSAGCEPRTISLSLASCTEPRKHCFSGISRFSLRKLCCCCRLERSVITSIIPKHDPMVQNSIPDMGVVKFCSSISKRWSRSSRTCLCEVRPDVQGIWPICISAHGHPFGRTVRHSHTTAIATASATRNPTR